MFNNQAEKKTDSTTLKTEGTGLFDNKPNTNLAFNSGNDGLKLMGGNSVQQNILGNNTGLQTTQIGNNPTTNKPGDDSYIIRFSELRV